MKRKLSVLVLVLLLLMAGCTPAVSPEQAQEIQALKAQNSELSEKNQALLGKLNSVNSQNSDVLYVALNIINRLKAKDMAGVASYVHPVKGLRFSPYSYIDAENGMVFTAQETVALFQNTQSYTWGAEDGTGDPIEMPFGEYFETYVYDRDYAAPHMIGNNVILGQGNTLHNVTDVYPESVFVEFHFTGFEAQYQGMDWASLRLIFEVVDGEWKLVAIEHDEWTI